MNNISVSIIIPVYNAEVYIQRCIDSILAQDYPNFEIILINDGSTDKSGAICEDNSHRDSRIKYYYQKNCGVSVARNFGLQVANGQWVAFIDADDYVGTRYISSLMHNSASHTLNMLRGIQRVDENSICTAQFGLKASELHELKDIQSLLSLMILRYLPFVSPCAKLFNLQIIRNNNLSFDENIHNGEDRIFIAQYLLLEDVKSISVIDYDEYFYVQNPKSATSTLSVSGQEWAKVNIVWNELFDRLIAKYKIEDDSFIKKHKAFVKTMIIDSVLMVCRKSCHHSSTEQYKRYDIIRRELLIHFRWVKCNKGYRWHEYAIEHLGAHLSFVAIRIRLKLSACLKRMLYLK